LGQAPFDEATRKVLADVALLSSPTKTFRSVQGVHMASRGINKVILIGNLGADPEVRYTQSGTAVANLRIATNERWRDRQSGEQQERTEWHRVVLFGKLGEIASEYLRKGSQVFIEGRLQTRKWQGQDGQDRYTTEIVGNDMQMLGGGGPGGAAGGGAGRSPGYQDAGGAGGMGNGGGAPAGDSLDDDEIPF